jgi:hypothetical protein
LHSSKTRTTWADTDVSYELTHNRYNYAVEKLTTALGCLATHPGDARERLLSAYVVFHTLRDEDFPSDQRDKWKWVIKELTKFGPSLDYKGRVQTGSVEHTMSRIKKRTAAKIAKAIYELYWVVSENKQYF